MTTSPLVSRWTYSRWTSRCLGLSALVLLCAAPAAADPKVTAQHGGSVEHAVVSGGFAYVAQGSSIVTLRLGDSSEPTEVASVSEPVGGLVWAVAVHQYRLYASWWGPYSSDTLSVFSLADPSRPAFLGRLDVPGIDPLRPLGMALVGDTLYVLAGPGLVPIDLSDPDQPVAGAPTDALGVRRLTRYGNDHVIGWGTTPIGYFAARVFDVSAPLAPAEVGTFLGGIYYDLDVGDGLVVASGHGFAVFDLTDPANPIFVSTRGGYDGLAGELVGDHFLVADGDILRTWDLGDPANPVEVATVSAPVAESRWAFHAGERALVFTDLGTAVEFDVADPSDPALVSSLDLPVGTLPIALAQVGANYYVGDAYRGLRLLDAKMRTLADVGLDWPSVLDLAVDGSHALFADISFGLRYVDVSAPAAPVPLGEIKLVGALSVEIDGDRAWATADTFPSQLVTVDLSIPSSPQIVHSTALGGRSKLQRVGDLLFLADPGSGGGLRIFNISGTFPLQLSRLYGCRPRDVHVYGSIAALPCSGDELQLVDVSDPTDPVLLGTYEPDGNPNLLASVRFGADGQIVYLGFLNGVDAVDVSDPTGPTLIQRLPVGGYVTGLETYAEGHIWALGGEAGLARIDQESGVAMTPQSLDKPSALRRRVD